jgi:hypothetical protein
VFENVLCVRTFHAGDSGLTYQLPAVKDTVCYDQSDKPGGVVGSFRSRSRQLATLNSLEHSSTTASFLGRLSSSFTNTKRNYIYVYNYANKTIFKHRRICKICTANICAYYSNH